MRQRDCGMKLTMDLVSALSGAPTSTPPSPPSLSSDRTRSSSDRTRSSDETPTRTARAKTRHRTASSTSSSPSSSSANSVEDATEPTPTYLALAAVPASSVVRVEAVEDESEEDDGPPRIYLCLAVTPASRPAPASASPDVPRLRLDEGVPQVPTIAMPPLIGAPAAISNAAKSSRKKSLSVRCSLLPTPRPLQCIPNVASLRNSHAPPRGSTSRGGSLRSSLRSSRRSSRRV